MRIGIDVRSLSAGRNTGVEEYIRNLLPKLFVLGKNHSYFLFYNDSRKGLSPLLKKWSRFPNVKIIRRSFPNKILNGLLWAFDRPRLNRFARNLDLFFFPNLNFFALDKNVPFVLTFHDLSYEHFPRFFNLKMRLWHFLINPRRKALKSGGLIAVSTSTAQDLSNLYRVPFSKIEIVSLGLDPIFFKNFSLTPERKKTFFTRYGLENKPFLLYLGTVEPRKNLVFLLKSFSLFKEQTGSSHQLVIAGPKGWSTKAFFKELEESPHRQDINFIGPINNSDRRIAYRLADLFLFPSLFEGFGLPPLEALASGTPVIASPCASLLEFLGGKAVFGNPYDIGEFAYAIEKTLADKPLREDLSREGKKYATRFSWDVSARKTLAFFQKIESQKASG